MPIAVSSILEDTLFNIKDHVKDNYSAYLSSMMVLKGSAIVLSDIKSHSIGDLNILKKNVYPVMFYFPMNINISWLDTAEDELTMDLFISITLKGEIGDNLVIKALRYSDAFREMVNDDKTLGSAVDEAKVVKVEYFSSDPADANIIEIEQTLRVIKTLSNI